MNFEPEDILLLGEEIQFTPPSSPNWNPEPTPRSSFQPGDESERDYEEIHCNGRYVTKWSRLRPSETIADIQMRINNEIQKFITREGEEIFIYRKVLKRLNFEKIKTSKSKEFKVNLPDKYEVKVHVYSDGRVKFHHYRKKPVNKGK